MSIHRPKRATTRRADAADSPKTASSPAPKIPKWKEVVGAQPEETFVAYDQSKTFAKDTLVAHAKFGKGVVVEVDGNKIQILFEEGTRKLLHGGLT